MRRSTAALQYVDLMRLFIGLCLYYDMLHFVLLVADFQQLYVYNTVYFSDYRYYGALWWIVWLTIIRICVFLVIVASRLLHFIWNLTYSDSSAHAYCIGCMWFYKTLHLLQAHRHVTHDTWYITNLKQQVGTIDIQSRPYIGLLFKLFHFSIITEWFIMV